MTTTAATIITRALVELGVAESNQAVDADDQNVCLLALNVLADAWLTEPNYAYTSTLVSASLPAATTSRTIGSGSQFNTARPVRLEDGCYITYGGVDFPLTIIDQAQYDAIPLKTIAGIPEFVLYDTGSPTGNVFFFPLGAGTVYLNVLAQLSQFTLNASVTLPPGYERAFSLTLAEEVAPSFRVQVNPLTARNAKAARRVIKRANFSVPQLDMGSAPVIGIPPIY